MADFTVTTVADVVNAGGGQLSVREALALADADLASADRIEFAPEVRKGRIVLTGGQLTINSDVTIDGGAGVTLDANQQSRVLLVQGGTGVDPVDVNFAHLTITGGNEITGSEYAGDGGGVRAGGYSMLTLHHTTVTGNHTEGRGGGIFSNQPVTLVGSTVSDNSAAIGGGGIACIISGMSLIDTRVSGNHATGEFAQGGGIAGGGTLTNSTVSDNDAVGGGGGIYGGVTLTTAPLAATAPAALMLEAAGLLGMAA